MTIEYEQTLWYRSQEIKEKIKNGLLDIDTLAWNIAHMTIEWSQRDFEEAYRNGYYEASCGSYNEDCTKYKIWYGIMDDPNQQDDNETD